MQMINCLGGDLQSWVLPKKENEKALRITDAMRRTVLRTALQGLAYVHANGITHCGNYIYFFFKFIFFKKINFFFEKKTKTKQTKISNLQIFSLLEMELLFWVTLMFRVMMQLEQH